MLNGLIVSCQAVEGEPLYGYNVMGVLAAAAVKGGANAIRTSSVADIIDVKKHVDVPVIGLIKRMYPDSSVYITPTLREVKEILATKCEVIAIDATLRKRPGNEKLADLVKYIKVNSPSTLIMADIATIDEALTAEKIGFDLVSTTLRGYTEQTQGISIPDYDMIKECTEKLHIPVIAEGGIWEADQLKHVLEYNVSGVVIGTAITRPSNITARFKQILVERQQA